MSSAVGPRPPVTITAIDARQQIGQARHGWRRRHRPRRSSPRPPIPAPASRGQIIAELVSWIRPLVNSFPIVNMPIFMSIPLHPSCNPATPATGSGPAAPDCRRRLPPDRPPRPPSRPGAAPERAAPERVSRCRTAGTAQSPGPHGDTVGATRKRVHWRPAISSITMHWRVLPAEEPLRLVRDIPGQAGEGQNRDQPDRPRQDRKDQIQRDADQRSRRPRRQGRKPAPETGGQNLMNFSFRGHLFSADPGVEMPHTGGKLTSFPPPCQ